MATKAKPTAALLVQPAPVTDVVDKLAAFDFSDVVVAPSADALTLLNKMTVTYRATLEALRLATEAQEEAQAKVTQMEITDLPDAMRLAGMIDFTLEDGGRLLVKEDIKCGITVANRLEAHTWLRDHGHGAVIKTFLEIDVRALTMPQITTLKRKIVAAGAEPVAQESVHNATLKSLVKEILEAGTTLPPAFSVHQFKKAELKETKVKRK